MDKVDYPPPGTGSPRHSRGLSCRRREDQEGNRFRARGEFISMTEGSPTRTQLPQEQQMEPETAPGVPEEPARASRTPYVFVLQCGIITSVLALAGVYWLARNTTDFHIMGWYANYVIPAG